MPVGPYKTFGDCVAAQQRKGKSKESAGAICGAIEKRTKQKKELELEISKIRLQELDLEIEILTRGGK